MPHTIRSKTSRLLAAVAAGAAGLVTTMSPPLVQAYPPVPLAPACDQWKYNGILVIEDEQGGRVSVPWDGLVAGTGEVRFSSLTAPEPPPGFARGGISGSHLDFTVEFPENQEWSGATFHYTGDVDPEFGRARGTYLRDGGAGAGGQWVADGIFTCAVAPKAPPPIQIQERPPDVIADAPPEQAPPAEQPKQGPTVSWEPIIGGLVAHITDRSGVTSQCTYTSDFYTRSFPLAAKSTFDLKIVPAIPRFRNWDVNIACDNGTSTQTTTFF